jgi:hypothetical protein
LLEAALGPHLEDVAKPRRCDQRGVGASTFDHGIGHKRCPVDDEANLAHIDASPLAGFAKTCNDPAFRGGMIGQQLGGLDRAAPIERDIREGATDIDASAPGRIRLGQGLASTSGKRQACMMSVILRRVKFTSRRPGFPRGRAHQATLESE